MRIICNIKSVIAIVIVIFVFAIVGSGWAFPSAPALSLEQEGNHMTIRWTHVEGSHEYILSYAPYPNADYIGRINLRKQEELSFSLWPGAALYVFVQARNDEGLSPYSNIEYFLYQEEPVVDAEEEPIGNATHFTIVDTGQDQCYNSNGTPVSCSGSSGAIPGQDANYQGIQPSYTDNGDGTVTDDNTGLMWQKSPDTDGDGDIDAEDKLTWDQAVAGAGTLTLGGFTDWRLPTIKELYSLIQFNGLDPSGVDQDDTSTLTPFIDTDYFDFAYGDTSAGQRIIDSQYMSATKYVSTTMNGDETLFGVNFADGRIKGYGLSMRGTDKTFFVIYVRGNENYGMNEFVDNSDGTVSDLATGLMWMQNDSGSFNSGDDGNGAMNWEQSLKWAESMAYAGYSDWRLPNAKELQSIVDYSRSPSTTGSAAIDPLFNVTTISDESGGNNYPFYWTGTTHANMHNGMNAVYLAFGEALGWMQFSIGEDYTLMDVHGAGAQRSDPKVGDAADYPHGHGPQGDVIRIYNYVRLVRDISNDGENVPEDSDSDDLDTEENIDDTSEPYEGISFPASPLPLPSANHNGLPIAVI